MRLKMLGALLMGTLLWPLAAHGVELRVLSSWDASYPPRPRLLDVFLKNVEAASKGELKFTVSGPETVPPFEQLQPASAGVFQVLFTHGAYHNGQTPFLLAVEGMSGDLAKWREAGVRGVVDQHYQKHSLKLIALGQCPDDTAFQLILRKPVGPAGDLQGRKIRGTQTYAGVFALLGASPVVLPPSEIYSALEKGVVDGAGWPVLGVLDYRWYEVAPNLLRPTFGKVIYPIMMNLNAWNKLTDAQRQIMLEEGRKAEDMWYGEWTKLADAEHRELLKRGAQVTEMGTSQKAKLARALADTTWEVALKYNAKEIEPLRDFAKAKGLY